MRYPHRLYFGTWNNMFKKAEFKGLILMGLNGAFDTINLEFVFSKTIFT